MSSSRVESLESRIAPATITVSFAKGALVLNHGGAAEVFSIVALDDTTTVLLGGPTTDFSLDGGAAASFLLLNSPLKSLTVNLGDFNDEVELVGLNVGGDVTINAGAGENKIEAESLTIKGSFKYTGGASADSVTLKPGLFSVKKDLVLAMGDGTNKYTTSATLQVGGKLAYTGGSGEDMILTSSGSVRIGGDLSFKPGAGNAWIRADQDHPPGFFTVGKKLIFDSSGSQVGDSIGFAAGGGVLKIGGDLQIIDGAGDLGFAPATFSVVISGKLLVTSGAGTFAAFTATSLSAKSMSIDASASSSGVVVLSGYGKLPGGITYTGGSGADLLQILVANSGGSLGPVIANLGDGNNSALVGGILGAPKAVKLIGGSGNDALNFLSRFANSTSVDIQLGGGANTSAIGLISAAIPGKVSVTSAADAISGTVTINATDAVIGSLDLFLPGGNNQVNLGSEPPAPDPGGGGGGAFNPFAPAQGPINGLTIKKAFRVTTGDGTDKVDFRDASDVTVAGGINLLLGNGTNEVSGTPSSLVAKSLSVLGGTGADKVALNTTGRLGAVSLTLGSGVNEGTLSGGVTQLGLTSLVFSSTSATGEADSLTLARVIVTGKLDAKLGADESTLEIQDSIFNGLFTVDTGAGEDFVEIDTAPTFFAPTILAKAVTIRLGADDDTLHLGDSGSIITKATFTADGGTGTNDAINVLENVFAKPPTFTNLTVVN